MQTLKAIPFPTENLPSSIISTDDGDIRVKVVYNEMFNSYDLITDEDFISSYRSENYVDCIDEFSKMLPMEVEKIKLPLLEIHLDKTKVFKEIQNYVSNAYSFDTSTIRLLGKVIYINTIDGASIGFIYKGYGKLYFMMNRYSAKLKTK